MTSLDTLFHWVREREAIRLRKDAGHPFPWTDDPILQTYRFCCVRREDDRVTRWIAESIRHRFAGHPHLWFMLCIARQINWPDTLAELIERRLWPSNPLFNEQMLAVGLAERAERGDKVFTGAYIVHRAADEGGSKTSFVAGQTLGALWRNRGFVSWEFEKGGSLQTAHTALTRHRAWGPFLAYQAVVDMRFCRGLLAGAADITTWAAAGPGTLRGLNRIASRPVDQPLSQEAALAEMLPLHGLIERETGVSLDLSDVPNVLCETDKYLRVKNGEGKPRALYVPGRGA